MDESKQVTNSWGFQTSSGSSAIQGWKSFPVILSKGLPSCFPSRGWSTFVTDQGNFIIDLDLKVIEDAEALCQWWITPSGLSSTVYSWTWFPKVIVGTPDGPVISSKIGFSKGAGSNNSSLLIGIWYNIASLIKERGGICQNLNACT